MGSLRQYVISMTATAMICGMISGMVKNSFANGIVRMVCGLLLVFTTVSPLSRLGSVRLSLDSLSLSEMEIYTTVGENTARSAMADIIKTETEAYILDKASEMNLDITAEVILNEDAIPIPTKVVIFGNVSPYDRQRLADRIHEDLGITRENQQWTG